MYYYINIQNKKSTENTSGAGLSSIVNNVEVSSDGDYYFMISNFCELTFLITITLLPLDMRVHDVSL
jgi:hypothetical protein